MLLCQSMRLVCLHAELLLPLTSRTYKVLFLFVGVKSAAWSGGKLSVDQNGLRGEQH